MNIQPLKVLTYGGRPGAYWLGQGWGIDEREPCVAGISPARQFIPDGDHAFRA